MFLPVIVIVVFPAAIPLVGLKLVSATIFQLDRERQFYWWRKPEYQEKTIACQT
jgi:hypothetical protein